jgi:hypothetical protein
MEEKYVLDLKTGFIKSHTPVMDDKDRYLGRYIPWEHPIPATGRVDLEAYHKSEASKVAGFAADIAKSLSVSSAATSITETATATSSVQVASPVAPATASPEKDPALPEGFTPQERQFKIIAVMSGLTVDDMTKSPTNPLPTVSSLNRLTGLTDIEGPEREQAFATFKAANPDWKPKESAA